MRVNYNGVELMNVRERSLQMFADKDPTGTDNIYTRVELEVSFQWSPYATSSVPAKTRAAESDAGPRRGREGDGRLRSRGRRRAMQARVPSGAVEEAGDQSLPRLQAEGAAGAGGRRTGRGTAEAGREGGAAAEAQAPAIRPSAAWGELQRHLGRRGGEMVGDARCARWRHLQRQRYDG
jgi:hypothetical protein